MFHSPQIYTSNDKRQGLIKLFYNKRILATFHWMARKHKKSCVLCGREEYNKKQPYSKPSSQCDYLGNRLFV